MRSLIILLVFALLASGAYYFQRDNGAAGFVTFDIPKAFEDGSCQKDAVLTANERTSITDLEGHEIRILAKHSPVYLCELEESTQRVVFPQEGTPSDCSIRAATNQCLTGFVVIPFETIILG